MSETTTAKELHRRMQERITGHTPGPWKGIVSSHRIEWGWWIESQDGKSVAAVSQGGPGNTTTSDANARLIAAAPDYDKAARSFVAWLDHYGDGMDPNLLATLSIIAAPFRAAIARAKGEQS